MMHLFLNGVAASAGGGLTYLRNVVPHLSARSDVQTTVAISPDLRQEFRKLPNVMFLDVDSHAGAARRFWQEQTILPRLIRRSGADVLISTGNFALRKSPVPQILLSRNSLYTSEDFFRDLLARRDYRIWMDTRIKGIFAKRSIQWADLTVAPSEAFAQELRQWTGNDVVSIHHGFDRDTFFRDTTPLVVEVREKLDAATDSLRLLFVSHYNYYRNFETLLRAMPLLQDRLTNRRVSLFLTCKLRSEENPGLYAAEVASALVRRLNISNHIVELGAVPYHLLHHLYRASDIYVTAAYAESFAHPLVEAMASGLPVVASDLAVHREICGDAALYFPRFSPELMAEQVLQVYQSSTLRQQLSDAGLKRSRDFSWSAHVAQIVQLAERLMKQDNEGPAVAELKLEG
jgi:glycosyltransferase involved in cell wall biosynthesis